MFPLSSILRTPRGILGAPVTTCFPSLSCVIFKALPGNNLRRHLACLHRRCDSRSIYGGIRVRIIGSFIAHFRCSDDGCRRKLTRLGSIIRGCKLPSRYIGGFRSHGSSVTNGPFPTRTGLASTRYGIVSFNVFGKCCICVSL